MTPFVFIAALTPSVPPTAHAAPATRAPIQHRKDAPVHRYTSEELFSLRERRRFAAYLRMRLLELREAGLDRAAGAIRRHLPVDTIFAPASEP